jgi:hypothetical protein
MELKLIPDTPHNYVDLFDNSSIEEKRAKFISIKNIKYLMACNHCSGNQGTDDPSKRLIAAQQIVRGE